MKFLRIAILILITGAVVGGAIWFSRSSNTVRASPSECVHAFYSAAVNGDAAQLSVCLAVKLQGQAQQLVNEKSGVLNVVKFDESIEGRQSAYIVMHEIRRDETRRVRYHLKYQASGWRIAVIGSPTAVKMNVPYGTHVGKVPNP